MCKVKWIGVIAAFSCAPACGTTELSLRVPSEVSDASPLQAGADAADSSLSHQHGPSAVDARASAHERNDADPYSETLRFVVLGDGGTGDENQRRVARAVKIVCQRRGCEFALYLGDNIYEVGVDGVDDAQFWTKFEEPFAELDFPFYVVLGNHDYGSGIPTSGTFEPEKVAAQIEYTAHSDKWNMPSRFYAFELGPAAFFALDTGMFVYDLRGSAAAQQGWLDQQLAAARAPWKFAFGHHPYNSSGWHGNAGNYEGSRGTPSEIYPTGEPLAALVEHSLCDRVDVFFAGHDHHREWLEPQCGTQFIISGAAAKLRPLAFRDQMPSRFADDARHGFLWVELDRDRFTGVFYDEDGQADYQRTFLRGRP